MIVTVLNRFEARDFIPEKPTAIIRIEDSSDMLKLRGTYEDELRLYFQDTDETSEYAIQEEDIKEICKFIKKNENVEEFIVNCNYGKGRSPAVGKFIAELFNIKLNGIYPNINEYVYSKLKQAYNRGEIKINSYNK